MSARTTNPNGPAPTPQPLIAVTMGDPAGIGAEVIVKALSDSDLRRQGRFVIYGLEKTLLRAARDAGIVPFWHRVVPADLPGVTSGVVVVDFSQFSIPVGMPAPTREGGKASLAFLDHAIEAARTGDVNAICTGPIHKISWKMARCRFPGHTEKLAHDFDEKRVTMAFVADDLRVALASAHIPLFDLRNRFTIGLVFQPIDLLSKALQDWFGIPRPHLAVAALNPHAGEQGRFGDEETRVMEPAIAMAREAGIDVEGPFAADTLFVPENRRRFDGIIAMYHDQGLIPVKMYAFHRAVNLTLGLPLVRTSPDHGTAFDIAGQNRANPGSMQEALKLACTITGNALQNPETKPPHPKPDAGAEPRSRSIVSRR